MHRYDSNTRPLVLGCIADDFTGGTDLANNLARGGMRVIQTIGVPPDDDDTDADAIVIALKSRTLPAHEAVEQSLEALRWLQGRGAQQIYFKYCSTFDSTPQGNIGPVTDALMDALGVSFTIACPAFPESGRSVYKGHLFVEDLLLNESGMRHHPLTPMTDANLMRVLQPQTRRKVGHVDIAVVSRGPQAISERFRTLAAEGVGIAIVDAIANADLDALAWTVRGMPLVTAASGLASSLPANFGMSGLGMPENTSPLPPVAGSCAIVSGSCSLATNAQVRHFEAAGRPSLSIDPLRIAAGHDVVAETLRWAEAHLATGSVLIYSTAEAKVLQTVAGMLGSGSAGTIIENALATIAQGLASLGVRRLILAGGETAGACVQALQVRQLRIGRQIDPGVPWCHATRGRGDGLHLALKSGNFGAPDFFSRAFEIAA
jgi:uncharacterized protein YgbK (DUF1537 family)